MRRNLWLALGAVMAVLAVAPAAAEDSAGTPAPRAAAAKRQAAKAKRKPVAQAAKAPAAPEAYQLVPSSPAGSALVRARQNSFGTRDEEASSSGVRSRHIGIGLGGGNGMTPGMAIGF